VLTSQIPDRRIPYCVSVERVVGVGGRWTSGLAQLVNTLVASCMIGGSNTKKTDFCSAWPLTGRLKSAFDAEN
jgi:hypothetical protein